MDTRATPLPIAREPQSTFSTAAIAACPPRQDTQDRECRFELSALRLEGTSLRIWRKRAAKRVTGSSQDRLRKARRISMGKGRETGMAYKFLTRRFIAWALLPLLLIGLVGAWVVLKPGLSALRGAGVASNMPQDEFERRVRTYLVDHPEVIVEA